MGPFNARLRSLDISPEPPQRKFDTGKRSSSFILAGMTLMAINDTPWQTSP